MFEPKADCPHHGVVEGIERPTRSPEEVIIPRREIIEAYLRTRRATMWPPSLFYLHDEDRLAAAADWIEDVIDDVNAIHVMAVNSGQRVLDVASAYRRLKEGENYG